MSTFAAKRATESAAILEDLAGTGELAGAEEAYETLGAQVELLRQSLETYVNENKRTDEPVLAPGKS